MNYPTTEEHTSHASAFWKTNEEPTVGLFVIVSHQGYRSIKKTMTSVKKLGYKKLRVYLIDASETNKHKTDAKKLSMKYIGSSLEIDQIYEKISTITTSVATVTVTAGIVVKKNMLKSLVPYMDASTEAVAGTLVVSGDKARNSFVGIRQASLVKNATNSSIVVVPLELANVNNKLYSDTDRQIVEHGLHEEMKRSKSFLGYIVTPTVAAALIALIALPVPIVLSINAFTASESSNAPSSDIAIPTTISSESKNKKSTNQNVNETSDSQSETTPEPAVTTKADMKNPDSTGAAKTVVLQVNPGDSVSSLITGYINDMHTAFPGLTLARLGYAQDCLMNEYGYKPIPAGTKTFTIEAKDVDHVWEMKEMADHEARFWADYAIRAGIRP